MSDVPSFFAELLPLWQAIDAGAELPTPVFLAAVSKMITIFPLLGSAFSPVKSDMNGNVGKLQAVFDKADGEPTVQAMVQADVAAKNVSNKNSAACAGLWLTRALQYIGLFLAKLHSGTPETLSAAASEAYTETLAKVHGWATRQIFNAALLAAPKKDAFMAKLGPDQATVLADMGAFLAVFQPIMANTVAFFVAEGVETNK